MDIYIGIIGAAITFVSLGYAIYENRRNVKLINFNREQAWEIYRQSTRVLQYLQMIEKIETDNSGVIENVSKGEAVTQELMSNSIHLIKRFEKDFSEDQIKRWYDQGKLPNESHLKTFISFMH